VGGDLEEPLVQGIDVHAVAPRHARDLLGDHAHQHHLLVQHLVVLEIVEECRGRPLEVGDQEDGGAGDAHRRARLQVAHEVLDRQQPLADPF
jgi:hypothetical protein